MLSFWCFAALLICGRFPWSKGWSIDGLGQQELALGSSRPTYYHVVHDEIDFTVVFRFQISSINSLVDDIQKHGMLLLLRVPKACIVLNCNRLPSGEIHNQSSSWTTEIYAVLKHGFCNWFQRRFLRMGNADVQCSIYPSMPALS